MAQAKKGDRALGPYRDPSAKSVAAGVPPYPGNFRVTIIYAAGSVPPKKQKMYPFTSPATEEAARQRAQLFAEEANQEAKLVQGKTVAEAFEAYLAAKKRKPGTLATKTFRFRGFFPEAARLDGKKVLAGDAKKGSMIYPRTMLLGDLTPALCEALDERVASAPPARRLSHTATEKRTIVAEYQAAIATKVWGAGTAVAARHGVSRHVIHKWKDRDTQIEPGPIVDDTRLGTLVDARAFLGWCVKKKWLRTNPLADVRPELTLNEGGKGKNSLTIDETVLWEAVAYPLAEKGDKGAAAALIVMELQIRATQVVTRIARDIDAGGAILRCITWSKNKRSEILHAVESERLRPILASLKIGLEAGAFVFAKEDQPDKPRHRDWVTREIRRICRLAGVPELTHAHGMRGGGASYDHISGRTLDDIQAQLGHEPGGAVTKKSYVKAEVIHRRRQIQHLKLRAISAGESPKKGGGEVK